MNGLNILLLNGFNMARPDTAAAPPLAILFHTRFAPSYSRLVNHLSRGLFDDWMQAIGFPTISELATRKAALLLASLGPEGTRMYYFLAGEANEPYQIVVDRMKHHVG